MDEREKRPAFEGYVRNMDMFYHNVAKRMNEETAAQASKAGTLAMASATVATIAIAISAALALRIHRRMP